eukprot:1161657-Pelagomonas_calceolata.AAC.7
MKLKIKVRAAKKSPKVRYLCQTRNVGAEKTTQIIVDCHSRTVPLRKDSSMPLTSRFSSAKGVNTESKSSHAANDIMGEVKEHVFRSRDMFLGRMHNQGPVCRRSAPLVIGQAFTFALQTIHG